jgi:hypothetical protein
VTRLRQMMLAELQRRNYSDTTIRHYLQTVEDFARHFGQPPDQLGLEELRQYQAYLLKVRKQAVGTVVNRVVSEYSNAHQVRPPPDSSNSTTRLNAAVAGRHRYCPHGPVRGGGVGSRVLGAGAPCGNG